MTMTRRDLLGRAMLGGLMLAGGLAVSGLAGPALADDTIKIGAPFNLTGALSSLDAPALNGAKLAAEQINAAGGVLGKKIELVVYDTKTDPKIGRASCRERREIADVDV